MLRKVEAMGKHTKEDKLGANWDVTFKIIWMIKPNTYELEDSKGKKLQLP